ICRAASVDEAQGVGRARLGAVLPEELDEIRGTQLVFVAIRARDISALLQAEIFLSIPVRKDVENAVGFPDLTPLLPAVFPIAGCPDLVVQQLFQLLLK